MKVIGAGFGRTGTMSLKVALEELGFGPCYHMVEVFEHPEHAGFWEGAWCGKPVDWDGFFADYEATVDWPACTFYAELLEKHPDAKVLLSVRDPEKWYESPRNPISELRKITAGSRISRAVFSFVGLFVPGVFGIGRMGKEIIWDGTFHGRFEDSRHKSLRASQPGGSPARAGGPAARLRGGRRLEAPVRVPRYQGAGQTLPAPQRHGGDAAKNPEGQGALDRRARRASAAGCRRFRTAPPGGVTSTEASTGER